MKGQVRVVRERERERESNDCLVFSVYHAGE